LGSQQVWIVSTALDGLWVSGASRHMVVAMRIGQDMEIYGLLIEK
jgi:hypothetical protein